jgi:hypothetical protein
MIRLILLVLSILLSNSCASIKISTMNTQARMQQIKEDIEVLKGLQIDIDKFLDKVNEKTKKDIEE